MNDIHCLEYCMNVDSGQPLLWMILEEYISSLVISWENVLPSIAYIYKVILDKCSFNIFRGYVVSSTFDRKQMLGFITKNLSVDFCG